MTACTSSRPSTSSGGQRAQSTPRPRCAAPPPRRVGSATCPVRWPTVGRARSRPYGGRTDDDRDRAARRPGRRRVAPGDGRTAVIEMARRVGARLVGGAEGNDPCRRVDARHRRADDGRGSTRVPAASRRRGRLGDHRRRPRCDPGALPATLASVASSCSSRATSARASSTRPRCSGLGRARHPPGRAAAHGGSNGSPRSTARSTASTCAGSRRRGCGGWVGRRARGRSGRGWSPASTSSRTSSTWLDAVDGADLVVTGEGFLDEQSFDGKVVGGVLEIARRSASLPSWWPARCSTTAPATARRGVARRTGYRRRAGVGRHRLTCIEEVVLGRM